MVISNDSRTVGGTTGYGARGYMFEPKTGVVSFDGNIGPNYDPIPTCNRALSSLMSNGVVVISIT